MFIVDDIVYKLRELNLTVEYVTFNHCSVSSNLTALKFVL